MKIKSLTIILLSIVFFSCSRIYFEEKIIVGDEIIGPHELSTGDVDNDGDYDIVVLSYDNKLTLFENIGNNKFKKHIISENMKYFYELIVCDINGDKKDDILTFSAETDKMYLFVNYNNLSFNRTLIETDFENIRSIRKIDIDNDLDYDLILNVTEKNKKVNSLILLLNDSLGHFESKFLFDGKRYFDTIYPIDFDNDSDIDLVISSNSGFHKYDSEINWYKNDGNLNFRKLNIDNNFSGSVELVPIDLDLDGLTDIVSSRSDICVVNEDGESKQVFNHILSYYSNLGYSFPIRDNYMFQRRTIEDSTNYGWGGNLNAFDYNFDNDVDIITTPEYEGITLYDNNSCNLFTKKKIPSSSNSSVTCIESVDFNKDNEKDFIVATSENNKILLFEHDNGDRYEEIIVTTGNDAIDYIAIDFDNDSDNDLLTISKNINGNTSVHLFMNTNSIFEKILLFDTSQYFNAIECFDINNDSSLDIILKYDFRYSSIPSFSLINGLRVNVNGHAAIYTNIGNNTFKEYYISKNYDWFKYINYDNDNDIDILIAIKSSSLKDTLVIYENLNHSEFKPITITNEESSISSIDISDINNDLYDDILIVTRGDKSQNLYCYLNCKNNSFTKQKIDVDITGNEILSISDMDNDKLPDMVITPNSNLNCMFAFEKTKGDVWVYKNLSNLKFSRQYIVEDLEWPERIQIQDIDHDSDLDFIHNDSINIFCLENVGQLKFNKSTFKITINPSDFNSTTSNLQDVDNDNDMDIFFIDTTRESKFLYLNDGNYNFKEYLITDDPELFSERSNFVDIDNNNKLDVLIGITGFESNKLLWLKNLIGK